MRALMERGERAAREAQRQRVDEVAAGIARLLPQAAIEKLSDGVSISGLRLLQRWLDEAELRFATRPGR